MFRLTFVIFALLVESSIIAQNRIRIEIKSFPSYHSSDADVYIAGSFNNWNPHDSNFKFRKKIDGNCYSDLQLSDGVYEYKITRGGWDKVECKKDGTGIENHILKLSSDTIVILNIEGWADHFPSKPRTSTAGKNVHVIDTSFFIPQLQRVRRVWIYLPEGYTTSARSYAVLYMHDGQNVFDDATSYSGEWGVDECLDTMKKKCIVVAIDNGGSKRLNEYCPYDFSLTGIAANNLSNKGEGDQYVDFLVKTLKPFIDRNYRTIKDKNHTFIAGSSMGGSISLYAELKYPNVFGGAGIFSPAFWVGPKIFDDILSKGKKINSKIYFYVGKLEGETMVPDMLKAASEMKKVSHSKMITVVRDDGKHNEQTWRKEFPLFYEWIMQ